MSRAGELLPALLGLLLVARPPALGRPPRLREPGADHVKEHQLGTLAIANNSSNKTSLLLNSAQSAWKKTCENLHGGKQNNSIIGRNYKNVKTKSKAPKQKVGKYKHQQKLLSDILNVLMNQHKPCLIGNESMKAQVSRKWTGNGKLTETNMKLTKKTRKIFTLGKFEDTKTLSQHKMNSNLLKEFQIIEKGPTNNIRMKFQRELFDSLDTCIKYLGTKPSLVIAALSKADLLPTVERALSRTNMNNLESILASTIIKNQMVLERKHYHIKTLKKEKNKHTNDRFLTSAKQKELAEMSSGTWAQQKTNAIRRNQHKRLTDARKILISANKKSQHIELQKYGHFLKGFQEISGSLNSKPSGISSWERKSGKASVRPNSKFPNFLNLKQRAIVLQKGQPTKKEMEDAYITGSSQHRPNDSKYIWYKSFREVRSKVMVQVKDKKAKAIAAISVEENQNSFTQVMIPHKRKDTVQKNWLVYKTKSAIHERKQDEPFKIKASRKHKWRGNADDGHISEKERTAFGVERLAYSSRNDCTKSAKFNFLLPSTDSVENVKHTLFTPLMAQTTFPNQVEKIKNHSILPLWNIKQKKISYAQEDLKVRDRRAAVSQRQTVNTGSKHKNLKRGENSSTSVIHPPKPSTPSALNRERRKRSANGESVKVPVEFLSHLSSVLVAGATVVGLVIFALGLAVFCLFYKRRKICQFLGSIAKDEELPNGFASTDAQYYKPVSLSQYFHAGKSQEASKNQAAAATAPDVCTTGEFSPVIKRVMCDSSDSESSLNMPNSSLTASSRSSSFTSWHSSTEATCDCLSDDSSSHVSLSKKSLMENQNSHLPNTNKTEKNTAPALFISNDLSSDDQDDENTTKKSFSEVEKARIPKSRIENNTAILSPFNETLSSLQSSKDIIHLPNSKSAQRSMSNICMSHPLDCTSLTKFDDCNFPEPINDLNKFM